MPFTFASQKLNCSSFVFRTAIIVVSALACSSVSFAQSQVPAEPCPELPGDASVWGEQEHWTWKEICKGHAVNLQARYGGSGKTEEAQDWPAPRELSQRFLETVLADGAYRSRIPRSGIEIVGARFPESIRLPHVVLGSDLLLKWSRFKDVNLAGAVVGGHLSLEGSSASGVINMDSLHAETLTLTNVAFPSVWLATARIHENLNVNDSTVAGEFQMRNLEVGHDLYMLDSVLTQVILTAAKIAGTLAIEGPRRRKPSVCGGVTATPRPNYHSESVDLTGATVGTLSLGGLCYGPVDGPLNWGAGAELILTNASVHTLADGLCRDDGAHCRDNTWPDHLELTGFAYRQLASFDARREDGGREIDMASRPVEWWTGWLRRQTGYSPQSYEYLAGRLLKLGHAVGAKDILYEGKDREREIALFPDNIKLWLERAFIGYGYRIQYALIWVVAVVVLGAVLLRISGEGLRNRMPYGIAFSFDMLLPVVKLREYHYSVDLNGWVRYYFYFHKLMGYVLASFLIAGLAGLTK